jgi:hypothetical protein
MCGTCLSSKKWKDSTVEICESNISSNMNELNILWGRHSIGLFVSTPDGKAEIDRVIRLKPEAFQNIIQTIRNSNMIPVLEEFLLPSIICICMMY